jgi:hypothetical protein
MLNFPALRPTAVLRIIVCAAGLVIAATLPAFAMNDTGQTNCFDAANSVAPCSSAVGSDIGAFPRQDARFGRDAAAARGVLVKVGGGVAGFDFTKIANNGTALPETAALGIAPTDWACSRDNATGLTWEVKRPAADISNFRSTAHLFTWYDPDNTSNGGNAGTVGASGAGNPCNSTLATCDTAAYVAAANAAALCGITTWRVPSRKELVSIYRIGQATLNDPTYFPDAPTDKWTRTTRLTGTNGSALYIPSFTASVSPSAKSSLLGVRVVSGTINY